jgi:hypothetical protein
VEDLGKAWKCAEQRFDTPPVNPQAKGQGRLLVCHGTPVEFRKTDLYPVVILEAS